MLLPPFILPAARRSTGTHFCVLVGAILLCSVSMASAEPEIIYRETFGNEAKTTDQTLEQIGSRWRVIGSNGHATEDFTAGYTAIPFQAGNPMDAFNVGTGYDSQSEKNGFAYFAAGHGVGLLYTTLPSGDGGLAIINPADFSSITFSWQQNNATKVDEKNADQKSVRLAVQIDGKWYATAKTFFVENANFDNSWSGYQEQTFVYTPAKEAWLVIEVAEVGADPILLGGEPESNLSGNITGFGILNSGEESLGSLCIDTFTVLVAKK